MIFSEDFKKLVRALTGLPGIGPRQATRLAFFLINSDRSHLHNLTSALNAASHLSTCPRCFFVSDQGPNSLCQFCRDPSRNPYQIAIVAKETDLLSLEKTGRFHGHYLVLGDLNRQGYLDKNHEHRLKILQKRIQEELNGSAEEIILALSPTTLGEAVTDIIARLLTPYTKRLTRLGRGLPQGGEVEFADEDTLSYALDNRF